MRGINGLLGWAWWVRRVSLERWREGLKNEGAIIKSKVSGKKASEQV